MSFKEEIEACGFLLAKAGFVVVGGVGLGPIDMRRAGSPSETEARGRLTLFEVADFTEPIGDTTPRGGALATSGEDGRLTAGGFGGRDGLRTAEEGVGARDDDVPVLAVGAEDMVALLGDAAAFAIGPFVTVEAGLDGAEAVVLAAFRRVDVADGGLEVVDVLAAFDMVGGEGLTDPTPKVPELIT